LRVTPGDAELPAEEARKAAHQFFGSGGERPAGVRRLPVRQPQPGMFAAPLFSVRLPY
jgi:hypothetical protein